MSHLPYYISVRMCDGLTARSFYSTTTEVAASYVAYVIKILDQERNWNPQRLHVTWVGFGLVNTNTGNTKPLADSGPIRHLRDHKEL